MRVGLFCHLDDIAASLDMRALRERGLTHLAANVLYHDWACWTPLSRHRPLRRERGGVSAVPVGSGHPTTLRPAARPGALDMLDAARDAGIAADAWTVTFHRDDLDADAPVTVDAFGCRQPAWICPSSDAAAAYLSAHAADIAGTGRFERVVLEGVHFPLLQHGGAHERDLSRLPEPLRRLLEICFCPACMAAFAALGVEPEQWRHDIAAATLGDPATLDADERMDATVALRRTRVLALCRGLLAAGHTIEFADQPAIAGQTFRTGLPTGRDPRDFRATTGIDAAALAEAGARITALAYFRDPAHVAAHVSEYLDRGVPVAQLSVALRPGFPDSTDGTELAEKLRIVRALGIRDIAFYELAQLHHDEWRWTLDAIEVAAA